MNHNPLIQFTADELTTAWKRVKKDFVEKRTFVRSAFEVELVEHDFGAYISHISSLLGSLKYWPTKSMYAEVPKSDGNIRPGSNLPVQDRIIYSACVGRLYPALHNSLYRASYRFDCSYRFRRDVDRIDWLQPVYLGWKDFDRKAVQQAGRCNYVVTADVAGFYENIDIFTLESDLLNHGCEKDTTKFLGYLLRHWSTVGSRGIPQGMNASDILSKVYLHSIDEQLRSYGVMHIRYADDYRIFCADRVAARKSILTLSRLLRRKGLNLQTPKLRVLSSVDALKQFTQVDTELRAIWKETSDMVRNEGVFHHEYLSPQEFDSLVNSESNQIPSEVMVVAFKRGFLDPGVESSDFNATLFHYLLKRLGKVGSTIPLDYCIKALHYRPNETSHILDYFSRVGYSYKIDKALTAFLRSEDAYLPYQIYLMVEWLVEHAVTPTEKLIDEIRDIPLNSQCPTYVASQCRKFLARFGSVSDFDSCIHDLELCKDDWERAEMILSIGQRKLPGSAMAVSRFKGQGWWTTRAATMVELGMLPNRNTL